MAHLSLASFREGGLEDSSIALRRGQRRRRRRRPAERETRSSRRGLAPRLTWLAIGVGFALGAAPAAALAELLPLQESAGREAPVEMTLLAPGRTLERELPSATSHSYGVELAVGQYMHVTLVERGTGVTASLFAPDGKKVAHLDSEVSCYGPLSVAFVAATSGTHRLEVAALDKESAPVPYRIVLDVIRPADQRDRLRVQAHRVVSEAHDLETQGSDPSGWGGTSGSRREALAKYQAALPIWQSLGDRAQEACTLLSIALRRYGEGDFAGALADELTVLSVYQSLGDKLGEGIALLQIANTYLTTEEFSLALQYYEKALEISHAAGDRPGESVTLSNMGSVHFSLGEFQKSLEFYERSLEISDALNDRLQRAYAVGSIAQTYHALGEDQEAFRGLDEALRIHRSLANSHGQIWALTQIGRIRASSGETEEALACYEEALALARLHDNRFSEADLMNRLAALRLSAHDYERAIVEATRSFSVWVSVGDRSDRAKSLMYIGEAFFGLGDISSARESLEQAAAVRETIDERARDPEVLYRLALVARAGGQLAEALHHLDSAIGVIESLRRQITSPDVRAAYTATVAKTYELAIDVLMSIHRQDPERGFDVRAFELNERRRARSLAELLGEIRADIREGVSPQLIERERNLRLRIDAAVERRIRQAGEPQGERASVAVQDEIGRLQTEYARLSMQIRSASPRYAALTDPVPMTLAEIEHAVIAPDTVLLEYALGESRSFLWAVTPQGLFVYELPPRARIEDAVRQAYSSLTARSQRVASETDRERRDRIRRFDRESLEATATLSDLVLKPAIAHLSSPRLVVVPDGALNYFPLSALPISDGTGRTLLGANHEIVSLPSASVLAVLRTELRSHPRPPRTLIVLADPVFEESDPRLGGRTSAPTPLQSAAIARSSPVQSRLRTFELERAGRDAGGEPGGPGIRRLPFTRREANGISARLSPADRRIALGFEATRDLATDPDLGHYRLVHFATHGFLNSAHPELSGIVLSLFDRRGKPRDGFVLAGDVFNLKLSADLVVLSGCRTGLGKEIRGEGLAGLTRAFFYAGAARVLVSLWDVDDVATAELMKRFYEAMLGPAKLRPAAALRQAQRALLRQKRWEHPYYWAGFVLQGEWR